MNQVTADEVGGKVSVDIEKDGIGTDDWTGMVSPTAIAETEIRTATADAGGLIDFSGRKVSVSTWGQTSATVY